MAKQPYFISRTGKTLGLVVVDYVPYLPTGRTKHTAHAVVNLQKRHGIAASVTVETHNANKSAVEDNVALPVADEQPVIIGVSWR